MLEQYLDTLDLTLPKSPNLAFLNEYTRAHLARFTFNNLAVLLRETISLETSDIFDKVISRQRGGYCFEHNKIAHETLKSLGYSTRIILARVLNNHDRPVPRTHRITLVKLGEELYLIDVGFGGTCPVAPISLSNSGPQTAGFEQYQVNKLSHSEFELVLLTKEGPFLLYRFDLAVYTEADCEMGHFYSHQHPRAVFVNNFVVSRKTPSAIYTLINHRFTQHTEHEVKEVLIDSADALRRCLTQELALIIEPEICDYLFDSYIKPKLNEDRNEDQKS